MSILSPGRVKPNASNAIMWQGKDCFTHMLVVGPTRSGKTATVLKPMIYQLLIQKKRGIPLGLSVVEPKGDVAALVHEMCEKMGIPHTYVDPLHPEISHRFNPMEGDMNDVVEATVAVLAGLFGKQDPFFATVQELSARNITKLLKVLYGDRMDIIDVMNTLRDPQVLEEKVQQLKRRDGTNDLVHFFETELLGDMKDKYRQFVIGLRAQLENIASNEWLKTIMTGQSDINMDRHFAQGGVLAVNTALGKLRMAGDAFGQFLIMHLQNATFRRPGSESTRIPHFLIVDEYSRYINPDVEMFLSLAAEYKTAGVFAIQSLGQLEVESGKIRATAMKQSILTSCRNKMMFGGISAEDAKEFADEFGEAKITVRQTTFKNRVLVPNMFADHYRDTENVEPRYKYTDLMDGLPKFHYVCKVMDDGRVMPPIVGRGRFIPKDWEKRREWEKSFNLWKKLFPFLKNAKDQPVSDEVPLESKGVTPSGQGKTSLVALKTNEKEEGQKSDQTKPLKERQPISSVSPVLAKKSTEEIILEKGSSGNHQALKPKSVSQGSQSPNDFWN